MTRQSPICFKEHAPYFLKSLLPGFIQVSGVSHSTFPTRKAWLPGQTRSLLCQAGVEPVDIAA